MPGKVLNTAPGGDGGLGCRFSSDVIMNCGFGISMLISCSNSPSQVASSSGRSAASGAASRISSFCHCSPQVGSPHCPERQFRPRPPEGARLTPVMINMYNRPRRARAGICVRPRRFPARATVRHFQGSARVWWRRREIPGRGHWTCVLGSANNHRGRNGGTARGACVSSSRSRRNTAHYR